jgi:hypothetical protein
MVVAVLVFVVGDPGGIDNTDASPINPGREEPIEGAATMAGAVRARSEEKDRCNMFIFNVVVSTRLAPPEMNHERFHCSGG